MKVGSIVQCIKKTGWDNMNGVKVPIVGEIYTIRGFYDGMHGKTSVYLEEIKNDLMSTISRFNFPKLDVEPSFEIKCFRELIPPEEEELEEKLDNKKEFRES